MTAPLLRQFGDLTAADFEGHPVWIQCHVVDYDEPWHDQTDEETFRPFTGAMPASPSEGMLLVRAEFTLRDGTVLGGFVTPAFEEDAGQRDRILGTQQPMVLAEGGSVRFWWGGFEPTADAIADAYRALGRGADAVFPIRFRSLPGLTSGLATGEIHGFYWLKGFFSKLKVRT